MTYRSWTAKTNPQSTEAPELIPAQKALVVKTSKDDSEIGQYIDVPHGGCVLYLMNLKCESAADTWLISKLKQIIEGICSDNVDASNLVDYLADKIQISGHKNQIAPYFSERVWSPENYSEILGRNLSAKIKYRLDLLPTHNLPDAFMNEERNEAHAVTSFTPQTDVSDPPFFYCCAYDCTEDTKVMEQDEFLYFMSLCYMRIKVAQALHRRHDPREDFAGASLQASHGDVIDPVLASASATPWIGMSQALDPLYQIRS